MLDERDDGVGGDFHLRDDGTNTAWCDGEWEYRVRVLRRGVYRELVTESVWFGFIPTGTGDDDGIGEAWDF